MTTDASQLLVRLPVREQLGSHLCTSPTIVFRQVMADPRTSFHTLFGCRRWSGAVEGALLGLGPVHVWFIVGLIALADAVGRCWLRVDVTTEWSL